MTDLVEIVARAIGDAADEMHISQLRLAAKAAIAAARPVIEAEVREQCAKVAEDEKYPPSVVIQCDRDGDLYPDIYNTACQDIAAAIRNRSAENDL